MYFNFDYVYKIFETIAGDKSGGLYFEQYVNKKQISDNLLLLERWGYIKIKGKKINEEKIIEYNNLDFTEHGKDLYLKLKDIYNTFTI